MWGLWGLILSFQVFLTSGPALPRSVGILSLMSFLLLITDADPLSRSLDVIVLTTDIDPLSRSPDVILLITDIDLLSRAPGCHIVISAGLCLFPSVTHTLVCTIRCLWFSQGSLRTSKTTKLCPALPCGSSSVPCL